VPRAIGVLLVLGLTVYALVDCVRTDSEQIKGLPKVVWVLLIVLVTPVGPIVWLVAGRDRGRRPPPVRRRPTAPDDDPEFLRRLTEQRRQQAEDERLRAWEAELRDRNEKRGDDGEGPGTARS
jgi:hypothetical protein